MQIVGLFLIINLLQFGVIRVQVRLFPICFMAK